MAVTLLGMKTSRVARLIDTYQLSPLAETEIGRGWLNGEGQTHVNMGLCTRWAADEVELTAAAALELECPQCLAQVPTWLREYCPQLWAVVSAYEAIARTTAASARGEVTPHLLDRDLRTINTRLRKAALQAGFAYPEVVSQLREVAQEAVNERLQIARQDKEALTQAYAAVRSELVPDKYRQHATFDHTPVLIGLAPNPKLKGATKTATILRAVRYDGHGMLTRGPRYLVDLINRQVGPGCYMTVIPMPSGPGAEDLVMSIIRLWDPTSAGPMSNLAHVARAAEAIVAT